MRQIMKKEIIRKHERETFFTSIGEKKTGRVEAEKRYQKSH